MELLPCPFCGGEALPTAHLTYNWFAPVCGRCNARGPSVKIERDSDPQEMRNLMNQADENWNRRASPASAPEGFALVPVVPTHAILDVMFNAGIDRHDGDLTILYRAILAAAPTPPVSEDKDKIIAAANALENIASTSSSTRIRRVANDALTAIRAKADELEQSK